MYKGKLAGTLGIILRENMYRHSAEFGYWLGEEFWNNKIMTISVKAAIPYFLESFKLHRFFATVAVKNTASIRVLENSGFIREGAMKKYAFKNGEFIDGYLYAYVILSIV